MLEYFLSPAKADLLPTDWGRPPAPTSPGYGPVSISSLSASSPTRCLSMFYSVVITGRASRTIFTYRPNLVYYQH